MPGARCQHTDGEKQCGLYARRGQPFCARHAGAKEEEKTEAMSEVNENDPLGVEESRRSASKVSAENAALAATFMEEGFTDPFEIEEQVTRQTKRESQEEPEERKRGTIVPPTGPQNLESQALRASLELLAEDRARALLQQEARAKARRMGKKLPPLESRLFVADAPDVIAITDKNGKSLVRDGWIGRWVRLSDSQGRQSNVRLREFLAWGAEVILDPDKEKVDGKLPPKTDVWGIAVQIPAARYGARVIAHSPRSAFDSDLIMSHLDDLAESINSESGYAAVRIAPTKEHGSRSL